MTRRLFTWCIASLLVGLLAYLAASPFQSASLAQNDDETISRDELDGLPPLIALTVADDEGTNLALYDWQADELQPIVTSDGDDGHSTWSPDGAQLAFQTNRDGDWEIYLYDLAAETERNLTDHPASDMYPNWTPDGQVVHFSDRSGEAALWLTDPATGDSQGLTTDDDCAPDYHPSAALDGERFAYRADCAGSGDIWLYDTAQETRTNLTADSPATDRYPAWSPDGEQLLFISHRDGNQEVYIMDADGANVRNLTEHPAQDAQASWSPDGRFIIFVSDREGQPDLWLMEADGSRPTRLLQAETALDWPWWQPLIEEEGEDETAMGNADVEFVRATQMSDGTWRFEVTVRHPDTGWEDYADGWDVVLPDGTVLKRSPDDAFTRLLLHPHVGEQPFTRSQSGLVIPDDVTQVTVRAHDIVDGWGGREVEVDLTQAEGEGFVVERQ